MRHIPRPPHVVFGVFLLALLLPSLLLSEAARPSAAAAPERVEAGDAPTRTEPARVRQNYGSLPLSFEANHGQTAADVSFLARGSAYSLYLTGDEITLALRDKSRAAALRLKLVGANREPRAYGLEELEGKSHYLVGRDPSRWRTNVPNFARVKYESVYPGVDVVYYGNQRQLEYDFLVAPGADAGRIALRVEGAKGILVGDDGDLVLPTAAGEVRQQAPHAYQEVGGVRQTVACRYVLLGPDRVGFELGAYDQSLPLVIDPVISYSTLLGGSGYDQATSIAVDAQGNAYVTGNATSLNFPTTPGALRPTKGDFQQFNYDAFVTKLNADGTAFVYSTYLGGNNSDVGTSIAVNAAGHAYVAGQTNSANFPTTAGAYATTPVGGHDIFIAKLNAAGSALDYSTYLGGTFWESDPQLALGGDSVVYVGGRTESADFPTTPGAFQIQSRTVGGRNPADGFVAMLGLSPGSGLIFSTFLSGSRDDFVEGLALGPDGSVYVTGRTSSHTFPTTPGAFQTSKSGGTLIHDAFLTRLHPMGTQLIYSTFFGGPQDDWASGLAVDETGAAYLGGYTSSPTLPVTPGAFQTAFGGSFDITQENNYDGFVAKFSPDGASLAYSTFFGGNGGDQINAVALDAEGNVYAAGETNSTNLPAGPGALQPSFNGGHFDAFFLKLDAAGAALPYVSYLGGGGWEQAKDIALDADGGIYLTGNTESWDFNVTPGAPQRHFGGGSDGFITKVALGVLDFSVSGRVTNEFGNGLRDVEVSVSGTVDDVVRTNADGYYTVNGLPEGADVTLTASRGGFTFEPESVTLEDLTGSRTANFSGPAPLLISGRVTNDFGDGVVVPMSVRGAVNYDFSTNYDGSYFLYVPSGGDCVVTAGPDWQYDFEPPSHEFMSLAADQTADFAALRPPRIIARVVNDINVGIADIQVALASPAMQSPLVYITDHDGYVYFDGLERGASYTVSPSDPETNRSFTPPEQTIGDLRSESYMTFTALPPVSIHGRVADANFNGVTATATLSGTVSAEVEVDQWGNFSFMGLLRGGDYAVTITKPGTLYTFAPPSQSVTNLQEVQFLNFEALPPIRIIGHVARPNGAGGGLPATVTLTGTVNRTAQADENGGYVFDDLPRGGDYTVTPSYPLHTFSPPSHSVTNAQETPTFFTFEALPPLSIIGGVVGEDGLGVAGVTVTLDGSVNATTSTDETGAYQFRNLPRGGNYAVSPAHDLYTFAPPSREFAALAENQVAGFDGALRRFRLSGRVADSGGAGLSGVTLTLGGSTAGERQTDANGNYAFDNLAVGRPYTVTPARPGYAFAPSGFNVADPRADQTADFTASHLTYTLTGRVTDNAAGAAVAGATVSLSGSLTATVQADAQGNYTFTGLPSEGDYTVTPSHPNFNFAPAARSFTNLLADASADFGGTRINYQLGGRVVDTSGAALAGATVTLGGACAATTQTDANGQYLFADLPSGFAYTVSVSKTHYTFNPPARQVEDLGGDTTADFTATLLTHSITGRVLDVNGNGFAGATVQLIGTPGAVVNTDASGNYAFNNLPAGGNYTVRPTREFYDFSPTVAGFLDLGADQTANFTATLRTFHIGGRVAEGTAGLAGVTVTLTGSQTATTQTDAAGNYLFTSLPANGTYNVAPAAHAVYAFSPPAASFNTLPSNQTANFAATRRTYQVSGHARDACGRAIPGVTLSLVRAGATVNAQTDANGFYSFAGVVAGHNYTLAPVGSTHTFTPASFVFNNLAAGQTANFTGQPPTATSNVLPLADLYVRGGSASSNFGTSTQLITRLASNQTNTHETYLKFNAGQPCTVTSVRIRLYGRLSSSGTLPVALSAVPSTTWTETGTTWNNRPAAGAFIRTVNVSGTAFAWYEWDVTDYVRNELAAGRSTVSFVLKGANSTSTQATFNSREATGANAPRLVITTP